MGREKRDEGGERGEERGEMRVDLMSHMNFMLTHNGLSYGMVNSGYRNTLHDPF